MNDLKTFSNPTTARARKIKDLIQSNDRGQIFSVDFVKADGSPRTLTGRLGVQKGKVGAGPSSVAHMEKYLTVWEKKEGKDQFRNVNMETVTAIRMQGMQINMIA